jgi:FAD/FMN-containing dehydrogenase
VGTPLEAFGPGCVVLDVDPASSNRATVGGGIGNNSTGAHSVRYGITVADNRTEIEARYPDLK